MPPGEVTILRNSAGCLCDSRANRIDPSIITRSETRYLSVDVDHGAAYGNTLTWDVNDRLHSSTQKVEIQFDLDAQKFYRMFTKLMIAPTPH